MFQWMPGTRRAAAAAESASGSSTWAKTRRRGSGACRPRRSTGRSWSGSSGTRRPPFSPDGPRHPKPSAPGARPADGGSVAWNHMQGDHTMPAPGPQPSYRSNSRPIASAASACSVLSRSTARCLSRRMVSGIEPHQQHLTIRRGRRRRPVRRGTACSSGQRRGQVGCLLHRVPSVIQSYSAAISCAAFPAGPSSAAVSPAANAWTCATRWPMVTGATSAPWSASAARA